MTSPDTEECDLSLSLRPRAQEIIMGEGSTGTDDAWPDDDECPDDDAWPGDGPYFACPFYRFDPIRHFKAYRKYTNKREVKYALKRLSDVRQRLQRRHQVDFGLGDRSCTCLPGQCGLGLGYRLSKTFFLRRCLRNFESERSLLYNKTVAKRRGFLELLERERAWIETLYLALLYALIFLNLASEFPGKKRPPCTTMPWTIWPALVVLWGVCWMFNRPGAPRPEEAPSEALSPAEFTNMDNIVNSDPTTYNLAFEAFFNLEEEIDWASITAGTTASEESMPAGGHNTFVLHPDRNLQQIKDVTSITAEDIISANTRTSSGADHLVRDERNPSIDNGPSPSKFTCSVCSQNFTRFSSLQRHHRAKHTENSQVFPCPNPDCERSKSEKAFKRKDNLKSHLKTCPKPGDSGSLLPMTGPSHSRSTTPRIPTENTGNSIPPSGGKRKAPDDDDKIVKVGQQTIEALRKKQRHLIEEAEAEERSAQRKRKQAHNLAETIKTLEEDECKEA